VADFDAQLPVRALAVNFTTEVADANGLTINPAEDVAQGSVTLGQDGVLSQGAVTTAPPVYVSGQTDPLSLDTAGNLRVVSTTGSTTVVTGNVTVVQPTGTNLHAVIDNFPADADALAQGSTTSGQLGSLIMGAVTTVAPTDVTGTTSPLSLDIAGNLRVSAIINNPTAILTYFTDAAIATNATVTHSLAGPINLDHIHATGSGEIKMNVATGATGSETDKWVGFTSSAVQSCEFDLEQDLIIPAGSSVKVTLTNRDKAAQDLYLTFETH
jgi:hypothetical protein